MLTPFITFVLLGWIPACAVLFGLFRPVRALTLAYLIGWLALPMSRIPIEGFWDIDKILATNVGAVAGVLLFHSRRIKNPGLNAADILLAAFAVGAFLTSVFNGLGVKDGVSSLGHKVFFYAVPYVLGRLFLRNREELLEASRIVIVAAACYALLAVWEWRMSPQIHVALYGFFPHGWGQHIRWGFWRPIVCFPHALGLGTFMAWTALLGVWLWRRGQLQSFMGLPPGAIVALVLLGLLTSMSVGPWGLFAVGFTVLLLWRRRPRSKLVWLPAMFALFWMTGRYTGLTDGAWFTSAVAQVSEERAASLDYRIRAEELLLERAKERPVFGWGTWGRNRATDETGRDLVATDGLWIIFVGSYGLVGLLCFYGWWCWPLVMSATRPPAISYDPVVMPLLTVIGLQAVNFLFNGFLSPILTLMCGGVVSTLCCQRRPSVAVQTQERDYRPALLSQSGDAKRFA